MTAAASRSRAAFEQASRYVPGGVHSNSRFREPYPLYFERAEGAWLWDLDGRRYLDCTMGNGAIALGHRHPEVTAAVREALAKGLTTGYETELGHELAELLASIVPGFGLVRFANTGTEALMHALRIARAATGRERIAKAEGAYHGWADAVWVSCWAPAADIGDLDAPLPAESSAGLSRQASETLVFPFNDVARTENLLRRHAAELAAVVVEPVLIDLGYVPAQAEFLASLRALTTELGIVLIFDELLTGFRVARGGARELYGVEPDLTLFGKALANGYPLAAIEGRPELLALTDPGVGLVGYVGTFNGHAISLAAAVASMQALRDGSVQHRLEALTVRLRKGFEQLSAQYRIPVQLAGGGGHFQPYFTERPVASYRDALGLSAARYTVFRDTLFELGILVAEKPLLHCSLSAAHTEAEVDALLEASERAFAAMAADGQEQGDRSAGARPGREEVVRQV